MLYKQPMQQQPRSMGNQMPTSQQLRASGNPQLAGMMEATAQNNRPAPMRSWAMPTVSGPKQGGSSAYQAPSWAPQPQNQRPNTFGARPQSYGGFPDRGPDSLQRLGHPGYVNDGPGQGGAGGLPPSQRPQGPSGAPIKPGPGRPGHGPPRRPSPPEPWSRPDDAYYGQQEVSDAVAQRLGGWSGAKPWEIAQWSPGFAGGASPHKEHPDARAWAQYQADRDALIAFEEEWGSQAVGDWKRPGYGKEARPMAMTSKKALQWKGYGGGGYVEPKGYAGGGPAQGTDTEPAMLTPGEFVVSRPAVQKIGINNLLAMNAAGGGTNRPTLGPGGIYARGGGPVSPRRTPKYDRILGAEQIRRQEQGIADRKEEIADQYKRYGLPGDRRPGQRPSPTYGGPKKPKKKPFQGANNNFIVDLATDYQDKLDASNAANEARYEQLLAGYDDLSGSVLGQLSDSIGESRDIHGNIIEGWGGIAEGWGNVEQGFRSGYGGLHQRSMQGLAADALANEEKYGNILGQYGTMRDRILGGFTSQGQDQIAESRKAYDESLAATNAAMATRGMAGTTVGGSMKQQTDRGYQDAVRGIQESVLRRKTAADMGISQAQLSQEANFQRAREAAQARRLQTDMGISQNAMRAIAGAQQGGLAAQQGGLAAQQNMASQLASQQAQRANMEATLQKGKFGVIERREDTGPDFNQLMGLVQGAASTGYGQGYGGGYGTSSGGSGGAFSMNDYLQSGYGGGGANPYEAVAAGLLGHTAKPKPGAAKPKPQHWGGDMVLKHRARR